MRTIASVGGPGLGQQTVLLLISMLPPVPTILANPAVRHNAFDKPFYRFQIDTTE